MSEPDPVHGTEADRWGGWHWRDPSRGEHFRTCSYCGSINPEDLAAETDWSPSWADQKYGYPHKVYASIPNRDPDVLFCIGAGKALSNSPDWVAEDELTDEQRRIVLRDGMRTDHAGYLFGTRPTHHAKLYTVHLADPAIPAEARDKVQRASGLMFTFEDGTIGWQAYA